MLTEKGRKILSEGMKGENNPRWNGGNSDYPNHAELKKARLEVLKRTKGKCEICGKPAKLIHHMNGDKSNHNINNLMAVCSKCHSILHHDDDLIPNLGRPLKYNLICGMPIKRISEIFGVCTGTIYYWLKSPEKEKWLKEELNKLKEV